MPNDDVMHAGPFSVVKHSWSDTSIVDANGDQVCFLGIDDIATEETQDELEAKQARTAELLADAPAAALALALICAGVASIATVTPPGFASFSEFVFDGTHYALSGGRSWTDVINLAGWTRCREALAARGGA